MGAPLTSWDGVEAYFTYADRPGLVWFFLLLAVAVTVAALVQGARHERDAIRKAR